MKKVAFVLALGLTLLSCNNKAMDDDVDQMGVSEPVKEIRMVYIDAFLPELNVRWGWGYSGRENGDVLIGFNYAVPLPPVAEDVAAVLEENRVVDASVTQTIEQLICELQQLNFQVPDGRMTIMYAGVSGEARIYSDREVAGRKAGENLSDLFTVEMPGRIVFPGPGLFQEDAYDSRHTFTFKDYFVEGVALDMGYIVDVIAPMEIDESAPLYVEIPVTGISLSGEEKTVVFKGYSPGQGDE